MDNQEYLNQITSSVRPTKNFGNGFLSSNVFKIIIGAIVALILIVVVGNLLGSGKNSLRDRSYALQYRLENTMSVISTYQPKVKSSILRSASASFYGALQNTHTELGTYLAEKYNLKDKNTLNKLKEQADLEKDDLESELFEAKINGFLDRIYAHKMAYEISVISSKASSLLSSAKDDTLKTILDKSIKSLDNIYNNFNDFTEGNK